MERADGPISHQWKNENRMEGGGERRGEGGGGKRERERVDAVFGGWGQTCSEGEIVQKARARPAPDPLNWRQMDDHVGFPLAEILKATVELSRTEYELPDFVRRRFSP